MAKTLEQFMEGLTPKQWQERQAQREAEAKAKGFSSAAHMHFSGGKLPEKPRAKKPQEYYDTDFQFPKP